MACVGDSLTNGSLAVPGEPYPQHLGELLGPTWSVTNFGIPGELSGQMVSIVQSAASSGYNSLVLMGGINDAGTGVDAPTILSNLETMYGIAQNARMAPVVAVTLMPVGNAPGWSPAEQTVIEAVNAGIRNYAPAHGLPLFDAYAAFGEPGHPTQLAAAYDIGDGVHINDAGNVLFAKSVAAILSL